MKTNRLLKAELRKIFLRPAIFILSAMVIIAVFASYFFYVPETKTNKTYITGATVSAVYNTFASTTSTSMNTKPNSDKKISDIELVVDNYIKNKTQGDNLKSLETKINQLKSYYPTFRANFTSPSLTWEQAFISFDNLRNYVNAIKNEVAFLDKNVTYYLTVECFDKLNQITDDFKKLIPERENSINETVESLKNFVNTTFENFNYIEKFEKLMKQIIPIEYFVEDFQQIKDKYIKDESSAKNKLNSIMLKTVKFANKYGASSKSSDFEIIEGYFLEYINTATCIEQGINASIKLIIANNKSDLEINKYISFEDFNRYEVNTTLSLSDFLISSEIPQNDYLISLDYDSISGMNSPNAWDFMFYAFEIVSILIIIFAIYLASNAIAGEYSSGTIKLLAIRPYSRNKILFAKLTSTAIILMFFIIIASVSALLIGNFLVGPISLNQMILCFNGTFTFSLSPILVWLLIMFSLFFKALIFVLIALLISVVFKSNISAVVISFFVYILTMISNVLLSGIYFYKFTPMANMDLYKYFKVTNQSSYFSVSILKDSSFYVTLIYMVSLFLIISFLSFKTFKKKDIA